MAGRIIQAVVEAGETFKPKNRFWRLALFTPEGDPFFFGGGGGASGGVLAAEQYRPNGPGIGAGQAWPIPLGPAYTGAPAWTQGTPTDHWTRAADDTGEVTAVEDCLLEIDASTRIGGSAGQRAIYAQVWRAGAWQFQEELYDFRSSVGQENIGGGYLPYAPVAIHGKLKLVAGEKFRIMVGQANAGGVVSADAVRVAIARLA